MESGNLAEQATPQRAATDRSPSQAAPVARPPASPPVAGLPQAKEIVAGKVAQFARQRLDLARRLAEKLATELTPEMERFFTAVEAGNWEEAQSLANQLLGERQTGAEQGTAPHNALRQVLTETLGVAEVAHKWPAQALLDYGERILNSLEPGTIYVGGTDPGRFIPTLLNETAEGEKRIILTQNQLADQTYIEYVSFLYGDRIATLTVEDSQRAFGDYLRDATKRARHDQQFPQEPKQVEPNEELKVEGDRVQVSGATAVMKINGLLLQTLMAKNPDARFALEESFPIPSTYVAAAPNGPLLSLNAVRNGEAMPAEAAQQALRYWDAEAARLVAEPGWSESAEVRGAYGKLALAQANLLAHQRYASEAEQLYTVARQLAPDALEPVERTAAFLSRQGRQAEALELVDAFLQTHPDQQTEALRLRERLLGRPLSSSAP